ncbi:MAG: DUF3488 domain-containing protein [Burkholderiales bacterium]|nr:DUF3488 domain-containing protein [Burkholderiales bacterium]
MLADRRAGDGRRAACPNAPAMVDHGSVGDARAVAYPSRPQPHAALPRKWPALLIVAGVTLGIYLHYRTVFGRDAGVTLLIVMLALKTLETHATRRYIIDFLGYFIVITNFLYSQTIPTALYMLICVWVITATMIGLHALHTPAARGATETQFRTAWPACCSRNPRR